MLVSTRDPCCPLDCPTRCLPHPRQIPDGYLSVPEAVAYPTQFDGQPATAHMLYYPPVNK